MYYHGKSYDVASHKELPEKEALAVRVEEHRYFQSTGVVAEVLSTTPRCRAAARREEVGSEGG